MNNYLLSPHITIIIWGILVTPLSAHSSQFPDCPPGSFKTEVASPIDSTKKILCSKKTSTGYVKHGPEWIYDHKGRPIKKNLYKHDELVASEEKKEEEKKQPEQKADENASLENDYSFLKTVIHEILHLWHPAKRPPRGPISLGGFETRSCGVNNYTLSRFYENEIEEFSLELGFSKRCSLNGTNQLVWERPRKITLQLRDMRDFEGLEMQLALYKTQKKQGGRTLYRVQTEVRNAILRTQTGGLKFEADYIMSLDPNKRKALGGHGGELRLNEFNALKINKTYELELEVNELP